MDTSLISKVSEIILERRLGFKIPNQGTGSKGIDKVQISSAGNQAATVSKAIEKGELEREARIAEIKEKVARQEFVLSDEILEVAAGNIAKLFVG